MSHSEQATAYMQQHGLEVYLQDAAQLHRASGGNGRGGDSTGFMARYLTSVACGQHVLWRHYSFVAGTHFNRKCFLVAAQRCLAPLSSAAGRLSFGDAHSLLQLLCPDFPASVLKNAWSSAVAVQECESCCCGLSSQVLCCVSAMSASQVQARHARLGAWLMLHPCLVPACRGGLPATQAAAAAAAQRCGRCSTGCQPCRPGAAVRAVAVSGGVFPVRARTAADQAGGL